MQKERQKNRLSTYNYALDGYYFITTCTKDREEIFGNIKNEKMYLNPYGEIIKQCWLDLPNHYENCILGEYIIMPDHFHGVVQMGLSDRNGYKPFPTKYGLSEIIRGFKTFSSKRINELQKDLLFRWQKSFYDRIIRNESELERIQAYIRQNPEKWEWEKTHPENLFM